MNEKTEAVKEHLRTTVPLKSAWILALLAGAYSLLSLLRSRPPFAYIPDIPVGLDAALSFAMALLMSFRVNRAYERWWEARTHWGSLVNVSRNLAVKVRHLRVPGEKDRQAMRDLIVAFCVGLKDHLRGEADLSKLPGFEQDKTRPAHVPSYVVGRHYEKMRQWKSDEPGMNDVELLALDAELRVFLEVCGGCEKIKSTPVSISWRLFAAQCIAIYLVTLPWSLVDDFGMWCVPLSVVVTYIVVAAEAIARYVEQPFGLHEDHLNLDSITQTIDRSVSEILLAEPDQSK